METTLEIRWFAPGPAPGALAGWFDDLGAPAPSHRTDTYLLLAGADDLGLKLREGGEAFELKRRRDDGGDAGLDISAEGTPELWQKWSFPVDDASCRAAALGLPASSLVDVEKERRLLTYRLASDGAIALVKDREGEGCSVELTTLMVKGSDWWTFGFEAFGDEARLTDALTATASAFFAGTTVAKILALAPSCGYPAWLATVTAASTP